jgi:hypothetical protein
VRFFYLSDEELERLNPPDADIIFFDNEPYIKMLNDPKWFSVGVIPTPTTRRGWFAYHLIHGLVMRYPWWRVVCYAVVESRINANQAPT